MKGFTHFQTPSGKASIVDEGPYHWGIDYITVYFKGDTSSLQHLIPEGLEIADGTGIAYVGEFISVSEKNPESIHIDPAQTVYHEAALGVACNFQGRPGLYFVYMWVDKDWSLIRGWLNGYPKKLADEIAMTKLHPLNPLTGGIRVGSRLTGYAARHGHRIFTVKVKINRQGSADDTIRFGSTYGLRLFPATDPSQTRVSELVEVTKTTPQVDNVWIGDGVLTLENPPEEELELLKPYEIKYGCVYRTGFTISGAKVLKKITAPLMGAEKASER